MDNLYRLIEAALLQSDPVEKSCQVEFLFRAWKAAELSCSPQGKILAFDDPGRPSVPDLIDPRKLPRRSFASEQGRISLLHSFAHIEFNAINIALDAIYRFRELPETYISDWLLVAREEARHFCMLQEELQQRGSGYGALPAHRGLWDMVCKTRHDVLHRMALVPRVMEARGLDVSPGIIEKFRQVDDARACEILAVIYQDEIGHVQIGNRWYHYLCHQRSLDPVLTFGNLVSDYMGGSLRGPFNIAARLEAGFKSEELELLEKGEISSI